MTRGAWFCICPTCGAAVREYGRYRDRPLFNCKACTPQARQGYLAVDPILIEEDEITEDLVKLILDRVRSRKNV